MDDRVATAALAGDPAALADLVGQLRAQMAQLREEIAALKQDNVELRQQAHYWQSQHAQARKQINKLQQRLEKLQAENRNLRQQAFGRRGETSTPSNDETWLAALRDDPPGSRQRGQQAGRPGPARRDYQHLPARIEMVELPPAQRCCPRCGQAYVERHDSEDSELIEIEVHAYRRVLRRRRYQPQCRCTDRHGGRAPETAPQGALRDIGVGGDSAGQVCQPTTHGKAVSAVEAERTRFSGRDGHGRLTTAGTLICPPVRGLGGPSATGALLASR